MSIIVEKIYTYTFYKYKLDIYLWQAHIKGSIDIDNYWKYRTYFSMEAFG